MKKLIFSVIVAAMSVGAINVTFVDEASAKPKQTAEEKAYDKLVKDGAKAYENGDFDVALKHFSDAYAIRPESSLLYNMGRVHEDNANYSAAIENYQKFLMAPGSDPDARDDAKERIKSCQETLELAGSLPRKNASDKAARPPAPSGPAATGAPGNCVDINTADDKELQKLAGVGPAMSKKILEYRSQKGRFTAPEQLQNIKGVGKANTYTKIVSGICPLNGAAATPQPAPAAAQNIKKPVNKKDEKPAKAAIKPTENSGKFAFDI